MNRSIKALRLSEIIIAAILLVTITVLFTSPSQATNMLVDEGANTYKAKCATCHGADGSGKTPMGQKLNVRDLNSAEVQKQSDAQLLTVVAKGKAKMPGFEKSLSQDQMRQVVAYLREQGKKH